MAASKSRVEVHGVREVQAALKRLELATADLKAVHTAVAAAVVPGVAMRSPRRSGALAASWSPGATKSRARILSSVDYAGVIEYGWAAHGIEAAGMVRATIDADQGEILAAYERELSKAARAADLEVKP